MTAAVDLCANTPMHNRACTHAHTHIHTRFVLTETAFSIRTSRFWPPFILTHISVVACKNLTKQTCLCAPIMISIRPGRPCGPCIYSDVKAYASAISLIVPIQFCTCSTSMNSAHCSSKTKCTAKRQEPSLLTAMHHAHLVPEVRAMWVAIPNGRRS